MLVLLRALTYAALFIALVLVFVPARVLEVAGVTRPPVFGAQQIAGAIMVIVGGSAAIWCILTFALVGRGTPALFDPPRRLVVRGPYRFVRNPMYLGAGLALVGAALFYGSWALAGYAAFLAVVIQFLVLQYEEPTLRRTFGSDYEDYCRRVHRWWPRW
jgi:protein-S-isoprenylcysteine O-methyltransferase Ste14